MSRRRRTLRRAAVLTSAITVSLGGVLVCSGTAIATPFPSCAVHNSPGPHGVVTVQTTNRNIAWGVAMSPTSKSMGVWAVATYLDSKRTPSGFNRPILNGPYVPHGTIPSDQVRPGQIFDVRGVVFSQDGNQYLVKSVPCVTL